MRGKNILYNNKTHHNEKRDLYENSTKDSARRWFRTAKASQRQ